MNLKSKPFVARKRFGQHFLRDQSVVQHIVNALAPKTGEHIVEIGAGLGALTTVLLPRIGTLEVVELDRDLIQPLIQKCRGLGELMVHQADALRFDFGKLMKNEKLLRIIGNLPYNISTPLLFHLLTFASSIQDMLFMLQKEVAERIVAGVGEEEYGRLSVMVQYYCATEVLFHVGADAFKPQPKVESAIIRLTPYRELPYLAKDFKLFAEIVRLAFNQRRKTLRNSLHTLISPEQLTQMDIDPTLRAERLSVADYVKIANILGHQ